jgi:hypothetical protein
MINEDELMKDETSAIGKFCGEDDKVKAGKPCENCTCGRKEYFLPFLYPIGLRKVRSPKSSWKPEAYSQTAASATSEMHSDAALAHISDSLLLKLATRSPLRMLTRTVSKSRQRK